MWIRTQTGSLIHLETGTQVYVHVWDIYAQYINGEGLQICECKSGELARQTLDGIELALKKDMPLIKLIPELEQKKAENVD